MSVVTAARDEEERDFISIAVVYSTAPGRSRPMRCNAACRATSSSWPKRICPYRISEIVSMTSMLKVSPTQKVLSLSRTSTSSEHEAPRTISR